MFTSRLGILERLISISRHILGLRIINGLLRDVGGDGTVAAAWKYLPPASA